MVYNNSLFFYEYDINLVIYNVLIFSILYSLKCLNSKFYIFYDVN